MTTYNFVFSRIDGFRLDAAMVVEIVSNLRTASEVLAAFQAGVTSWVDTTREGRRCWIGSSEDLNIGDLSGYEGDPDLKQALEIVGIAGWRCVTSLSVDNHVDYDKHLVDESKLKKTTENEQL
jgi:hypothetical protein